MRNYTSEQTAMVCLMQLAQSLFSAPAAQLDEHARAIATVLQTAGAGIFVGLDRWLRDRRAHRRLNLSGLDLDVARLVIILDSVAPDLRANVATIASMVRNGWTREHAVAVLTEASTDLSLAALLVRLDDPVAIISDRAWQALTPRLTEKELDAVGACLPVVERIRKRSRVQRYPALREIRELLTSTVRGLDLLWQAASEDDSSTRFIACQWLVARHSGEPEVRRVLELALGDHNPRTRLWASEKIANKRITPAEARMSLIGLLESDPAPSLRLAALRLRDRQGDLAAVEQAALDSNANVRFFARKFLRRKDSIVDLRQRALEQLHSAPATMSEIVGALAALSEAGIAEDARIVRRFLEDPRPNVAREAHRTIAALPR